MSRDGLCVAAHVDATEPTRGTSYLGEYVHDSPDNVSDTFYWPGLGAKNMTPTQSNCFDAMRAFAAPW